MSQLFTTDAIKMGSNAQKIIERFTDIANQYDIQTKRGSDKSATQLSCTVDKKSICKTTIPHTPYGLRKWAELLDKLLQSQKLAVKDFDTTYFDFPAEYLKLEDKELVNAVLSDLEYRSFESSHTEINKRRLRHAIKNIVELGGAADAGKVMVWTEDGRQDFVIGENAEFELGRLSMLAELMGKNLVHDECIAELSKGLKTYQKACQDSQLTDAFPGMLCCDFKRNTNDEIIADGYVVQNDGSLLPPDATFRNQACTDPLKEDTQTWFSMKESDFMFSIRKDGANAQTIITVNKNRTNRGAVEKLSAKQLATVRRIIANFGLTWNPRVDFAKPDAYLNMVGNWNPESLSTGTAYRLIKHYAERIREINSFNIVDETEKLTIKFHNDGFRVFRGGEEYTLTLNGNKEALFTGFNDRQAQMFAQLVQAYEVKTFQMVARQCEAELAEDFAAAEMSDEEREIVLQNQAITQREIAARFRSRLEEINNRPGFLMILFDDEENHGVYLSVEGVQANYFVLTEKDYNHFLIAIGDKQPENPAEEPIKGPSPEATAELSAESSDPDSPESAIPGQITLEQQTDGNIKLKEETSPKMITTENRTGKRPMIIPDFLTKAAEAKREKEAQQDN